MRFACDVQERGDGRWRAVHQGEELGRVEAVGPSREAALDKLKQELRYRLELCPCSGETYQHIAIELAVGDPTAR